MKKFYSIVVLLLLSFFASAQCSDIFFSEYAEGSGNNKYLEIYNSSPKDINLEDYLLVSCSNGCGDDGLNGSWELTFIGVGPSKGDVAWYSTIIDANNRGCLADDRVIFHKGGAFQNVMGSETWVETWQGATAEGCASPVAPFDGSSMGTWIDNGDGTFTVNGKGSHVGLPKVTNGGEINKTANAASSIKYEYAISGDTAMTVDCNFGGGWWRYNYKKVSNSFEYDNSGLFSGKTVKAGEVFVIANPSADASIVAKSDTTHRYLSNGDDWYAIWKKSDYSNVDEIGTLGPDPGNGWETSGTANATKDKTLVRKVSTKSGSVWSVPTTMGEQTPGLFTKGPNATWTNVYTACVKGDGNNGAKQTLNINVTALPAGGANYRVVKTVANGNFNNGSAKALSLGLNTLEVAGVAFDRVVKFQFGSSDIEFTTLNSNGKSEFFTSSKNQWEVYDQNTWTYLGSHDCDCYPPAAAEVEFTNGKYFVDENAGTASVEVSIIEPSKSEATTVDVVITGGSAIEGTDYTVTSSTTLTFSPGDATNQTVTMDITNNADGGANKNITLALKNLSANAVFASDSTSEVVIVNDDYIVSDIVDVVDLDADLTPNNKGTKYEITGVVYGIDYDGDKGLSFTVIDATSGINIFNFDDVSDYVVTEGDEITVRGQIEFYNGLLELKADSIKRNSQGNTLASPSVVDAPSEETESEFIQLAKVWITNDTTTVWPSNQNVELTNANMDTFQIRIDKDILDMPGEAIIADTMVITGIGGQYDRSAPYNSGYQIFPRKLSDIAAWVDRSSVSELIVSCKVYPNPTSENLTVVGTDMWVLYEVYSVTGIKVSEGSFINNNLSVANLDSGNYIIRMRSADKVGTARFMIVR
ncbi:MAG: Calx-beta domain-containing protein [Bacteroidia bacterium]|nr:Calx-beta domain-containing protein [Bacteroidia bacterium]